MAAIAPPDKPELPLFLPELGLPLPPPPLVPWQLSVVVSFVQPPATVDAEAEMALLQRSVVHCGQNEEG